MIGISNNLLLCEFKEGDQRSKESANTIGRARQGSLEDGLQAVAISTQKLPVAGFGAATSEDRNDMIAFEI